MVKKAKKMSVTSIAAWPIFTHAIITPARTSESIDAPNAVYSPRRCFTITATDRCTEPCGPCSARRWPYTTQKDATHTVYSAKAIAIASKT